LLKEIVRVMRVERVVGKVGDVRRVVYGVEGSDVMRQIVDEVGDVGIGCGRRLRTELIRVKWGMRLS